MGHKKNVLFRLHVFHSVALLQYQKGKQYLCFRLHSLARARTVSVLLGVVQLHVFHYHEMNANPDKSNSLQYRTRSPVWVSCLSFYLSHINNMFLNVVCIFVLIQINLFGVSLWCIWCIYWCISVYLRVSVLVYHPLYIGGMIH